jgi:hypothetical protein
MGFAGQGGAQNLPLLCTFCSAPDDGESFGAEQCDIRRWAKALNRGGMSVYPKYCGVRAQAMAADLFGLLHQERGHQVGRSQPDRSHVALIESFGDCVNRARGTRIAD